MISYNYFRSYDSLLGRYLEADPLGLAAGPNSFTYVDGAPLAQADPLGLCSCNYGDCVTGCLALYGGEKALALLFGTAPFASIPYPGNKMLMGSSNPYTSIASIGLRGLGLRGAARLVRKANPISNVAAAGAVGYLVGLSGNCAVRCAVNCDQ